MHIYRTLLFNGVVVGGRTTYVHMCANRPHIPHTTPPHTVCMLFLLWIIFPYTLHNMCLMKFQHRQYVDKQQPLNNTLDTT